MRIHWGAVVVVAGCAGAREPAPAISSVAPQQRPAAPPAAVVLTERADLDGDGVDDAIALDADGILKVGGVQISVGLYGTPELSVVTLDASASGRRLLLVQQPEGGEDPPKEIPIFRYTGSTIERILGPSVLGTPDFPGDGTLHYQDTDWSQCGADGAVGRVLELEVTLTADASGRLVETARTPTGGGFGCDEWSACPFVDVIDDDGAVTRVGEILRWLRGADAYAQQTLALPAVRGALRVRLSEEKPEVTYLDEIYLDVDGARVAPASCADEVPAYCAADHVMFVLRPGETLDLDFAAAGGDLVASGYYVPVLR
jgi:hypothetical protein